MFEFDDKEEVEEMDTDDLERNLDPTEDQVLGHGESSTHQGGSPRVSGLSLDICHSRRYFIHSLGLRNAALD